MVNASLVRDERGTYQRDDVLLDNWRQRDQFEIEREIKLQRDNISCDYSISRPG